MVKRKFVDISIRTKLDGRRIKNNGSELQIAESVYMRKEKKLQANEMAQGQQKPCQGDQEKKY